MLNIKDFFLHKLQGENGPLNFLPISITFTIEDMWSYPDT